MISKNLKTKAKKVVIEQGVKAVVTIVVYSAVCKHYGYRMVKPVGVTEDRICVKTITGLNLYAPITKK